MNKFIQDSFMLETILSKAFGEVLADCLEELLEKFKEIIEDEVYSYDYNDSLEPTHYWQLAGARTYRVRDAWFTDVKVNNGYINGILQRQENDNYSYGEFQHNHITIDSLDEVLNGGLVNVQNAFNFPKLPPAPYLNDFQKYVDANLSRIFMQKCQQRGMDVSLVTLY